MKKTVMLGKIEARRRRQQRLRWLGGITNSMDMSFSKVWEILQSMGCKELDMTEHKHTHTLYCIKEQPNKHNTEGVAYKRPP